MTTILIDTSLEISVSQNDPRSALGLCSVVLLNRHDERGELRIDVLACVCARGQPGIDYVMRVPGREHDESISAAFGDGLIERSCRRQTGNPLVSLLEQRIPTAYQVRFDLIQYDLIGLLLNSRRGQLFV